MIISNSNMTQFEENEDFLQISIPLVISKKFNDIVPEIQAIQDRFQQTSQCFSLIMNIQAVLHKVTKKLKSQKMMFLFSEILENNYLVAIKLIQQRVITQESMFQKWSIKNMELYQIYILQVFMRLLCIRTFYESKNYYDTVPEKNQYKQRFSDQVTQSLQNLKVLQRFNSDFDENKLYNEMITQICKKCKSRSFFSFLINLFEEKEMFTQSDIVAQLKQDQQIRTQIKISQRKLTYNQELVNTKDNQSIKCNTTSQEKFISDCSYGSLCSQTPMNPDIEVKDQRIFHFLKQSTIINFSKPDVNKVIIPLQTFQIEAFKGFQTLNSVQSKIDHEDLKKVIQPFNSKTLIDKSQKSDEQQSVKSGNEKEIMKEPSVIQQKVPRRTIGQGPSAQYKIAVQVQENDVKLKKSKLDVKKQEINFMNTRHMGQSSNYKNQSDTALNKQKILGLSDPKTQIKFCQDVVQKLAHIKRISRELSSVPIFHDNILALDTPNKDMEDESQFYSRSNQFS